MLNRSINPPFQQVGDVNFIAPHKSVLSNGVKVFTFNADDKELVRVEFIFENVNWDINKPLQAIAVNSLFNSGTTKLSAKEIADKVDYYGAFLQSEYGADHITITLYSLAKHLSSVLPIVKSLLTDSVFPQEELNIFKQNQKQKLQVNLKKNDFLARKSFANELFGNTPYGSDIGLDDYEAIQRDDLIEYYKSAFTPENCVIVIAGKFGLEEFQLLDSTFGRDWESRHTAELNIFSFDLSNRIVTNIERADSVQNAIRMGTLAINRTHADFPVLQVLNTILGGYFGSRLMTNIREEKGYTYGIGSGVASLKHAGYFFIATEVGADVSNDALVEIYKEINLLREEEVGEEELDLVRNYMLGSLLGSLENIFSHADKFKNLYFSGLDYDYYERYIAMVKTVDAGRIKAIANLYLNPDSFVEVVVGKV